MVERTFVPSGHLQDEDQERQNVKGESKDEREQGK